MLAYTNAKICVTPNVNAKICVTSNVNPQREQGENFCVGHVDFMLFVVILFVLGTGVVIERTSRWYIPINIPKGGQAGRAGVCFGTSNVDVGYT